MKEIKFVAFTLLMFLFSTPMVYAVCDAAETNKLSGLANNVKASYEVIRKELDNGSGYNPPDGLSEEAANNYVAKADFFRIYINNITEELYVQVYNTKTKETKTYNYSDAVDGTISFDVQTGYSITKYQIKIFSSSKTGCSGRNLRTIELTTPRYNWFSEYQICSDVPEYYLCHQYVTVDIPNMTIEEFEVQATKYRDNKEKEQKEQEKKEEGFLAFFKEHKGTVIILSLAIITIGGLVTVIVVRKQRSRVV